MEDRRSLRIRDYYAEKYKQRMDREILRIHASQLPLTPARHSPAPQSPLPSQFRIHPVQSAWERVKDSAKRGVILSPEPAKHNMLKLRERRKDLELQPRMRFPSLQTKSSDYLSSDSQRSNDSVSVPKKVRFKENRLKRAFSVNKQPASTRKTYRKSMLSLQLGYSVGGSDAKDAQHSEEPSLDFITMSEKLSSGLTPLQRKELFKLIQQRRRTNSMLAS